MAFLKDKINKEIKDTPNTKNGSDAMKRIIKLLFGKDLTECFMNFFMGLVMLLILFMSTRVVMTIGRAMGFLCWHDMIVFGIIIVACLLITMIGRFVFWIAHLGDDEF